MAEANSSEFFEFIFSGASMRRWNDKLRPVELYEVDKQAHKMIVAWMLYEINSRDLGQDERLALGLEIIEHGLFEYLHRLVSTDIKPPVFYRIKENNAQYKKLNEWVLSKLRPLTLPVYPAFWQRMENYYLTAEKPSLANHILRAAHDFASNWEFSLIRPLNLFDEEIEDIGATFSQSMLALRNHVQGVDELIIGSSTALGRFANFSGRLRFQVRWPQTLRMPETNVLGHMFMVGAFAYFLSLELNNCEARRINNFFCGLFHDLPELLTRDIISPVKKSIPELAGIIKDCEEQEMESKILTPLRTGGYGRLAERLDYFLGAQTGSEFNESIQDASGVHKVDCFETLHTKYNCNCFDPKDGKLIKLCDIFSAYIEAHTSLRSGISSPHLREAIARIKGEAPAMQVGHIALDRLIANCETDATP
jgi:putative hydrolase of HD superfamily